MSSRSVRVIAALSLILMPVLAAAGQSTVTVSPFVSYVPSATTNPLAGFALTFGGTTGLALRAGAEMSISHPDSVASQSGGYRPWGADADAMLFLGGLGGGATVFSRALSPYVFAGIGMTGGDSAGSNVVGHGWSYGLGAAIPLGFDADIFAEARWRMSEYVLPTSQGAPDSRSAMRFGLSFHVGGGSSEPARGAPRPRRRHRMDVAEAQDDGVEYVVTPAPSSPQVVVVQPAPAPEPQVVYVEPEPAPQPVIVSAEPARERVVVVRPDRIRRRTTRVTVSPRPQVVVAPTPVRARPTARVYGRTATRPAPRDIRASSSAPRDVRASSGVRSSGASSARVTAKTPPSARAVRTTIRARAQEKAPAAATTPEPPSRTKQVLGRRP